MTLERGPPLSQARHRRADSSCGEEVQANFSARGHQTWLSPRSLVTHLDFTPSEPGRVAHVCNTNRKAQATSEGPLSPHAVTALRAGVSPGLLSG